MSVIVVGVDQSEGARAALRFALEEARLRQAKLRVVHAWQFGYIGAPGFEGSLPAVGGDLAEFHEAAEAALDETLRGSGRRRRRDRASRRPGCRRPRSHRGIPGCRPARRRLARARRLRPATARLGQPAVRTARVLPGRDRPRHREERA